MTADDIPAPRFLLVFMGPVLQHFAVRAYVERGRRLEMRETPLLRRAYPIATRQLLANRNDHSHLIAWLDIASELEIRGELGPFVSELARQLDELDAVQNVTAPDARTTGGGDTDNTGGATGGYEGSYL